MQKTNIIIGILLIIMTIMVFQFAVIDKFPTDYISMGFILISEIAAALGTSIKKSSDLEAWSTSGILIGYMIICILFSILFGRVMMLWVNVYVLIHILLMIATAMAVFFAYGVSKHNQAHNTKVMSQLVTMRECEAMIQTIYLNAEPQYRDELRKVYEVVKYADKVSDVNSIEIMMALDELKAVCGKTEPMQEHEDDEPMHKTEKIRELSQKVISLVNERTAYNTSLKHGNF